MKKTIIVIIVLIIVILGIYLVTSKSKSKDIPSVDTSSPSSQEIKIDIKNFAFNPETLNVKIGTKVIWTNNDNVAHTVTSDSDNLLNSPTLSPGQSFSFTFTKIGTTNYHCNIHKTMKGSIIVTE
ncbi:MAG: cupredoxin domain-containing protein [Candidatus Paceibacterota bacterium]|jgi:plastocyanin